MIRFYVVPLIKRDGPISRCSENHLAHSQIKLGLSHVPHARLEPILDTAVSANDYKRKLNQQYEEEEERRKKKKKKKKKNNNFFVCIKCEFL